MLAEHPLTEFRCVLVETCFNIWRNRPFSLNGFHRCLDVLVYGMRRVNCHDDKLWDEIRGVSIGILVSVGIAGLIEPFVFDKDLRCPLRHVVDFSTQLPAVLGGKWS